jgi:hypothetical protein
MDSEDIIKKIARLLDEDLGDADAFGNVIDTPSQVLSQVFYPRNRAQRNLPSWDINQPIEAALAEIDRLVPTIDPDGMEISQEVVERAKELVRRQYAEWQKLGGWQF